LNKDSDATRSFWTRLNKLQKIADEWVGVMRISDFQEPNLHLLAKAYADGLVTIKVLSRQTVEDKLYNIEEHDGLLCELQTRQKDCVNIWEVADSAVNHLYIYGDSDQEWSQYRTTTSD
jgi:hypothetical protein